MKPLTEANLATLRRHMVEVIDIEVELSAEETGRDTLSPRLRKALLNVPRHRFVPAPIAAAAYADRPLPIGFDKTISQPFLSALMIELLDLEPGDRVLEVGTGYGYQTALMAELARAVWSVEVVEEFVAAATERLTALEATNVTLRIGDGSRGWADRAPFDAILVSAAAAEVPPALASQLAVGGRMVLPLGGRDEQQHLARLERINDEELTVAELMPVNFTLLETA